MLDGWRAGGPARAERTKDPLRRSKRNFAGARRPVCPAGPPPPPDLSRKHRTVLGGRGADHGDRLRYAHPAGLALHAQDGHQPLSQVPGSLGLRVELPRPPAESQALEEHAELGVAGATVPNQIAPAGVLLMPVQMAYFDIPGGPTESTDPLARWWAGGSAIPQSPVSGQTCLLTACLPTPPGWGQSWSSSSAPSSSSSAAIPTISSSFASKSSM